MSSEVSGCPVAPESGMQAARTSVCPVRDCEIPLMCDNVFGPGAALRSDTVLAYGTLFCSSYTVQSAMVAAKPVD